MPTINATVYPNEAYVLVQTDWLGTVLRDTFQRIATQTWEPAADTGQVWQIQSGAAADFPVNGSQGVIIHAAAGTTKRLLSPISVANARATGFFTNFVSPTGPPGADFTYQAMLRFVDINNLVDVRFVIASTGTISVIVRQRVAAVDTTATTVLTTLPTSGVYGWTFEANGSFLGARIWMAGTPEPQTWNATLTTTFLTAGAFVTGTAITAIVTNALPVTFWVDNIVVVDLDQPTADCAIVTRRNTVTGEVVQLRPYVFFNGDGALMLECGQGVWWDTEPPLNVPLEYCTSACPGQTVLSGNPGFEAGTTAPWVATGGVLTSSTAFAHEGTSSGLLTPTGGVSNPSFAQSFPGVLAGTPLTFSAWVMSPQGWNGVMLRMSLLYTNGITEVFETPVEILDDGEWRLLTMTVLPDLNATATFSFITMGAPPNTTLFYVDQIQATIPSTITATACETVTVESDSVWLKNPLHPCLDVEIGLCNPMLQDCDEPTRISYAPHSGHSYAPNTVALVPANRRRIIPINRVRRDASGALRLIAHDCAAKDAILAINAPGDPLLFQAPAQYCIPDRYITVGIEGEDYLSVDQREQFRLMVLPYETVDRPQGPADGVCGARIMDLCDIYSSWGALMIAGLTWTDLLLGEASPNGPGQPDPPAAARTWDDVEAEFVDWDDVEAGGTRDWDELRDGL